MCTGLFVKQNSYIGKIMKFSTHFSKFSSKKVFIAEQISNDNPNFLLKPFLNLKITSENFLEHLV